MKIANLPPPSLVQDAEALSDLIDVLSVQPHVAVDTESNSMYAYKEQVCLLQFSVPEIDYLVDPLVLTEMSPLAPIFADPKIEKIFHGAEYDVVCLKRDFGFTFNNLFDTRIASRTLGWKRSGLRDLLASEFDVQIDKRFQRANWGKRPLPTKLLDYARLDTHYLIPLRQRLAEALHEAGRWEEVSEACDYLTNADAHDNGFDPEGFWRIRNTRELKPKQLAVLRQLYLFRNEHAKRLNRPVFKVIGDSTLRAIALDAPTDLKSLSTLPGMTAGQTRRYGEGILKAVEIGLKAPIPKRPKSNVIDESVQLRFDSLHEWRKRVARARSVESDIVLPREILREIARIAPHDLEALRKVMAPLEWRFKNYGEEILQTLWEDPDHHPRHS
ncbi:MAG: ribonuclease D [Anaerolineales bacterium]|nr:ribonuclease D [Anaerolineales bacterium]